MDLLPGKHAQNGFVCNAETKHLFGVQRSHNLNKTLIGTSGVCVGMTKTGLLPLRVEGQRDLAIIEVEVEAPKGAWMEAHFWGP